MSSLPLALRAGIALLAFAALIVAALVNFDLVYRGMLAMLSHQPGKSGAAAGIIVWVELSMAIFLLDSLRVSRIFPVIGQFPPQSRVRMAWLSGMILASLTLVQVGLVYLMSLVRGSTAAAPRGTGLVPLDYQFDNPAIWVLAFLLPLVFVLLTLVVSRAIWPIGDTALPTAAE